jgi:hypothetical protein
MPIWVMGGAYTALSTEGDMFKGVDVGEVRPWWKLEKFGVVPISAIGIECGELVSGVGIGA